jgi:hypothetical protein
VIDDQEFVEQLKPIGLEVETSEPDTLVNLIEVHRQSWKARMVATGVQASN